MDLAGVTALLRFGPGYDQFWRNKALQSIAPGLNLRFKQEGPKPAIALIFFIVSIDPRKVFLYYSSYQPVTE